MKRFLPIVCLSLFNCAPKVYLEVLEPADIYVPAHIQTIAVIDRSRPKSVGQSVLGALEGLATGESIGADTEGREAAMSALRQQLAASPRFEVVSPAIDREATDSSLFDTEMHWMTAQRICADVGCEGIVALEALDSDADTDHRVENEEVTDSNGKTKTVKVHKVELETSVLTAWRLYDVDGKTVVDSLRDHDSRNVWTAEANSKQGAMEKLPNQTSTVREVARAAGEAYARRIAPSYVTVVRRFYGKGSDQLKSARSHVRLGEWDPAAKIWRQAVDSKDPKVRGRAHYNLAVKAELDGDLKAARKHAKKAVELLGNGRARRYLHTIDARIADQARLKEQMQAAGEG